MPKNSNIPFLIALGGLFTILVVFVFSPLFIGVDDNGDFYRVISSAGIYFLSPASAQYFTPLFGLEPNAGMLIPYYATTHTILLDVAVLLNKLVYSSTYFDIRFLSLLYASMLLGAVYMAFRAVQFKIERLNWLYYALTVLIIGDLGYLAYFNSMYGEAPTYASLLLAISAFLYANSFREKLFPAIVFYISMFIFIGAKQQNCILAIPAVVLGIRLMYLYKEHFKRVICGLLTGLMLLAGMATFVFVSPDIKDINIHQSVFIGILKYSKDVSGDLNALGLDEKKLSPLAGTTYYDSKDTFDPKGEFMKQEFFSKISYGKIITYYITHPIRFIEKMDFTAQNAFGIVQGYLGNYPQARGLKPNENAIGPWEYIKQRTVPHTLWFVVLFEVLFLYFTVKEHRKNKDKKTKMTAELMIFLAIIGILQYVMPYIADGEGDISKHLFIFNLVFDIQVITAITWGIDTLLKRRQEIQAKFGVKQ